MPRAREARGVLYLYTLLLSLLFFIPARGAGKEVSLVTAWPGAEIYELCGHEAVRIKGPGIDSVWNFGVFNFAEPNFVYRFVKGETDYMVDSYPFAWFMPEYVSHGRRVEEQVLNLTPEEVDRLHAMLRAAALPPGNRYRYNYIKDNCSTRIADMIDSVAGGRVLYPDTVRFDTYREAMRGYHTNYPWYQMGIDVALGSGLEEELSPREELFIPVEFHRHASSASLPDGRPLVKYTNVIYEGRDSAVEGPTPFLLTPLWFSIVVAAVSAILFIVYWRRNCIPRWWYAFYFTLAGLAGCLVAFLVFVSSHAATSPNLIIFWLNPLQLLIPLTLWWRPMRYVTTAMMWLNVAAVGLLLVLMPVFDRGQAGQSSFIVLMATDVALALFYLRRTYKGIPDRRTARAAKKGAKRNAPTRGRRQSSRIKIRTTEK